MGPLWAYSCFGFQSANGEILQRIHGKKNVCGHIYWALQAKKRLETEYEHIPDGKQKTYLEKTIGKDTDTNNKLVGIPIPGVS